MKSQFELPTDSASAVDAALPQSPTAFDERIRTEQADSLLLNNQSFSVSGFVLATAFGLVFWWETRDVVIVWWTILMNLSQLARLTLLRRYVAKPPERRSPGTSVRLLCVGIALTSAGWGASPWLFYPIGNDALIALMMVVLMGMVSGGLASVSPYRPAVYCLVLPALTGLATAMFSHGDLARVFLGVYALAYILMTLKFGFQQNEVLETSMRIRLEKEHLASRLAEQVRTVELASLEKTRFFASASHDLRQPLHSIGLLGSALVNSLERDSDVRLAESLMRCVDALESSFSSMLDVSKLDAGVVIPDARAVPLTDIFRHLHSVFATQALDLNLSLRFRSGSNWVRVDPKLLERILGNLLHNGLKFTRTGGIVVVARRRRTFVSVEVWDSGAGIPERDLSRIFEEFYQVGNLERDRSRGLGMGLAIVRRLTQLMSISLQVKSQVGRGTVFKLRLPVATAAEAVTTAEVIGRPAAFDTTVLRILVVDDEESVRASMSSALQFFVARVEVADGLQQAMDIASRMQAQGTPIDMVISDFRLRNEEDGLAVVDQLRARLGRRLPALLVTGDTAPERVRRAQDSGIPVLYKPVRLQSLIEAIGQQIAAGEAEPEPTPAP